MLALGVLAMVSSDADAAYRSYFAKFIHPAGHSAFCVAAPTFAHAVGHPGEFQQLRGHLA
jgi:hypothetical protein